VAGQFKAGAGCAERLAHGRFIGMQILISNWFFETKMGVFLFQNARDLDEVRCPKERELPGEIKSSREL